jgi:UrcA family protein
MSRFMPLIAIFTLAIMNQAAYASPPDRLPAMTVGFADLDLDHTPGAIALYRRLRHAAEQACSSFRGRDIRTNELMGQCIEKSVAASIARIDRPALTRYYRSIIDGRNPSALVAKN